MEVTYDIIDPEAVNISKSLSNEQNNESFYTLIVNPDRSQDFDDIARYITFDKVDSLSVQSTSQITSYPLLTGDIMSDHKYDEPKNISISGTFSLNGNFNNTFVMAGNKQDRLKNIETYFEALQKYGITMSLICNMNGGTRFKKRDNLMIQGLTFQYGLNNIKFSISLKEVYFFESESDIVIDEYTGDPNMPTLAEFRTLDFAQDVIGESNIDYQAVKALADKGLIDQRFAEDLATGGWKDFGRGALAGAIIGAFVAAGLIGTAIAAGASVGAVVASAFPVGTIIVAAAAVVVGIGSLIAGAIRRQEQAKLIDKFKVYANAADNTKERQRFLKYLNTVEDAYNEIANNNDIKCYGISSNIDKQEMYLNISDDIYRFNFEKDTTDGRWSMKVTNITQNEANIDIKGGTKMTGNNYLLDLQVSDALFMTKKGVAIYLINKVGTLLSGTYTDDELKEMLKSAWSSGSLGYLGYSKEEMQKNKDNPPLNELLTKLKNDGIYKDLTQFELVITDVDMDTLKKAFEDRLYTCLLKQNQ